MSVSCHFKQFELKKNSANSASESSSYGQGEQTTQNSWSCHSPQAQWIVSTTSLQTLKWTPLSQIVLTCRRGMSSWLADVSVDETRSECLRMWSCYLTQFHREVETKSVTLFEHISRDLRYSFKIVGDWLRKDAVGFLVCWRRHSKGAQVQSNKDRWTESGTKRVRR